MRISENGLEMPRQWENCCCSVDLVDHRLTVSQCHSVSVLRIESLLSEGETLAVTGRDI